MEGGGVSPNRKLWSLELPYLGGEGGSGSYGVLLHKGIMGAFP